MKKYGVLLLLVASTGGWAQTDSINNSTFVCNKTTTDYADITDFSYKD